MNKRWEIVDLVVFCEVARQGSFVAAATQLGFSPAYVTKRIAHLEKVLGLRLFHRTTRRILMSEAGETIEKWAREVLRSANALDESLIESDGLPKGKLRVTSSLRMARKHLSPILASMRSSYPNLDVWLEAVYQRVDLLAEGVDIDFRMEKVTEPHLIAHQVASNIRVLCASPVYLERRGMPEKLADLMNHDCLLYRDFHQTFGVWHMQGPNGRESVRVTGPVGSNHSDIVWNWTMLGLGIGLYAYWDVADDLRTGQLVRVLPQYFQEANVWAVTAARSEESLKIKAALEFLTRELRTGDYRLEMPVDL